MEKHIKNILDELTVKFKESSKALNYLDWLEDQINPLLRKGVSSSDIVAKFSYQLEQLESGKIPEIKISQAFGLSKNNTLVELELLSKDWSQEEIKQAMAYLSSKLQSDSPTQGKIEIKLINGKEYKYLRWRENGKNKSKYLGRYLG